MKLAIGLLLSNGFPVPAPFVLGLTDLCNSLLTGAGNVLLPPEQAITAARVIRSEGFPVDTARNEIVRLFLDEDDADALLFLDADMRPKDGDAIHRLARHRLPLVTGRYQMRKPPFHTVAMRRAGPGPHDFKSIAEQSGLQAIDRGGAGCLLIHRQVLADVRAAVGDDWFRYQVGPNGLRTVSEDMWFYEQAIACGYQPYVDLDTVWTHVAQFEIGPEHHAPYRERYEQLQGVA